MKPSLSYRSTIRCQVFRLPFRAPVHCRCSEHLALNAALSLDPKAIPTFGWRRSDSGKIDETLSFCVLTLALTRQLPRHVGVTKFMAQSSFLEKTSVIRPSYEPSYEPRNSVTLSPRTSFMACLCVVSELCATQFCRRSDCCSLLRPKPGSEWRLRSV